MGATEFPRRRFITRHDVDEAAAEGRSLTVGGRDVLTDEAAQRAHDLEVHVARASPAADSSSGVARSGRGEAAALGRAVRAAVVAELGTEPAALDEVIERVLRRRS